MSSIKSKLWQPYYLNSDNPSTQKMMIAIKDSKPRSKSELVINKGEIVEVIEKDDSGWATGFKLKDHTYGHFPIKAFKVRFHLDEIVIINNSFRNWEKKNVNNIFKLQNSLKMI